MSSTAARRLAWTFALLLALATTACDVVESGSGAGVGTDPAPTFALFDLEALQFPFPNDLLKQGGATLALPTAGNPLAAAANSLDGLSTVAPILFPFDHPVDRQSFADALIIVNVTQDAHFGERPAVAVTCADTGATFGLACGSAANLAVTPVTPLREHSTYLIAVGPGVVDAAGKAVAASTMTNLLKAASPLVDIDPATHAVTAIHSTLLIGKYLGATETVADLTVAETTSLVGLELIRQSYATLYGLLETTLPGLGVLSAPIMRDDVAVMIPYTTESLTGEMVAIAAAVAEAPPTFTVTSVTSPVDAALGGTPIPVELFPGFGFSALNPTPTNTALGLDNSAGVASGNIAAVVEGSFASRDYQGATGYFHDADSDGVLDSTSSTIPFTLCLPNATLFAGQAAPVVVFEHGLLANRDFLFAIADTLAARGIATAAIDLVAHGDRVGDLVDNAKFALGQLDFTPDGVVDPAGAAFLNVTDLRILRDNFRQSTVDLLAFLSALAAPANADLATFLGHAPPGAVASGADSFPDLDGTQIALVGHSFGTAAAFDALALTDRVTQAVMVAPEANLTTQFFTSLNFQDLLTSGLASLDAPDLASPAGVQLHALMQAIVERADPLAYAAGVLEGGLAGGAAKDLLLIEVAGDQTIDNRVSDQLAASAGIPSVTATTTSANVGDRLAGLVRIGPTDPTQSVSATNPPTATHLAPVLAGQGLDYTPGATVPAEKLATPIAIANPIATVQGQLADFVDAAKLQITVP